MTRTAPTPTICVVDDEPAVLKAIERLLRAEGWDVKAFESAEAFLGDGNAEAMACLVLDVNMSGVDGFELQQRLREMGQDVPIVFLTGHGDIPMSVRAIKAGAADFLTKPVRAAALNAALRAAIEQHAGQRQALAELTALRARLADLTRREQQVLDGLVAGKLNKEIAYDLGIVEQTVKFHRARIMERLNAKSVAELMHIVARTQR